MSKPIKLFIILITAGVFLGAWLFSLAQEDSPTTVEEDIILDEEVESEDLDIQEPRLLPESPFYFLKTWQREIRSFFTFNSIAKARLRERFASEKLMELKQLAQKTENLDVLKRAAENYKKETEVLKKVAERLEGLKEEAGVGKFMDKYMSHQLLHQNILEKLEEQVPSQVFEKIQEVRERHLENFKDVMLKLEEKENLPERLENIIEVQKGSKFKEIKSLEFLKNLEEKVPEDAKETIIKVQENILKKFQEKLEKMPSEDQEQFGQYLARISGDKEKQLEILENLRAESQEKPEIMKINLEQARERTLERIEEKIRERLREINCPQWTPPAPGFCKEGRILIQRDTETGCPLPPKCIIPGETETP